MRYKFFLILVLLPTLAFAISVERTVLVPRQPGIFAANVHAALNARTTNTLVIWEKHPGTHAGHSIWGMLLSRNGTPTGNPFQIVAGPNTYFPDLIYNPDTDQFLLVYSNETNAIGRFELLAQTLGANGDRIGAPIRVSISTDRQKDLANYLQGVVYDPATKGYVIVWWRYKFGNSAGVEEEGLYGAVLNSNLSIRQPAIRMISFQRNGSQVLGPYVTDIAMHSPSTKLLIAGYSLTSQPGFFMQYFVAKADPTLQNPEIVLTKLRDGLSSGAAPHVNLMFLQSSQMAAQFAEGDGLKIRKINPNGSPIGPVTFFLNDPAKNIPVEFPDSASSSQGSSEIATVSLDDSITMTGRLFLQLSNADGVPNGPAAEIQSGFDGTRPPVIVALPEAPQKYAVIYAEGMQLSSPPGPNESSGLVLLKVTTSP
jgi:hypothetical protein